MGATLLIEQREPLILSSPLCGGGRHCPRVVRASRSWVVLGAMMILFFGKDTSSSQDVAPAHPQSPRRPISVALLLHCASARANHSLRVVGPELVALFAEAHDASFWSCLCDILNVAPDQCSVSARDVATFPLCLGGLGFRSASRTSGRDLLRPSPTCWAIPTWASPTQASPINLAYACVNPKTAPMRAKVHSSKSRTACVYQEPRLCVCQEPRLHVCHQMRLLVSLARFFQQTKLMFLKRILV